LKEVLRRHSLGLSQHQIARSCSISQSTVHEYLSAAQAAGVKWPAPENWDDQRIERTLAAADSPNQPHRFSEAGRREQDRLEMYGGIGDIWRGYSRPGRPMASTNRALVFGEK
jgi:transcriptional regulator with XRE-family HTH domain